MTGTGATARLRFMKPSLPPKPAGWSNASNGTTGVLSSQCLNRRIPAKQTLIDEIAAWQHEPQFPTHQSQLALHNR
jgi:hypothetical protein